MVTELASMGIKNPIDGLLIETLKAIKTLSSETKEEILSQFKESIIQQRQDIINKQSEALALLGNNAPQGCSTVGFLQVA